MMFDSHGNLGVDGRLPTDRPHVVKVYGSYLFHFGTNVGLNFTAASGTPVSKSVQSVYRYPILVEGRGSLGRTPVMSQTDLLVSHEFGIPGGKRDPSRVQRAQRVQPEDRPSRVRHGQPDRRRRPRVASSALRLANQNLQKGYNYEALLAATPTRRSRRERPAPATRIRDTRWAISSTRDSTVGSRSVSCSRSLRGRNAAGARVQTFCEATKHENTKNAWFRVFVFSWQIALGPPAVTCSPRLRHAMRGL